MRAAQHPCMEGRRLSCSSPGLDTLHGEGLDDVPPRTQSYEDAYQLAVLTLYKCGPEIRML